MLQKFVLFFSMLLIAISGYNTTTAQYIIVTPHAPDTDIAIQKLNALKRFQSKVIVIVPNEKRYQTAAYQNFIKNQGFNIKESSKLYQQYHQTSIDDYVINLFDHAANNIFRVLASIWTEKEAEKATEILNEKVFLGNELGGTVINGKPGIVAYHNDIKQYVQYFIGQTSKMFDNENKEIANLIYSHVIKVDTTHYDMKKLRADKGYI